MTQPIGMVDVYGEGYWERGEGSNYVRYADDPGWPLTAELVAHTVQPGAQLLEVACAKGFFVLAARAAGLEAWGCDISRWAIDHAHPPVRQFLSLADAANLPYPNGWFDIICSWEFLEHVPEPLLDRVLDEMERVTKPDAVSLHRIEISDSPHPGHDHDATHVLMRPKPWWYQKMRDDRGWQPTAAYETFDEVFTGRDWSGRFLSWRMPLARHGELP